MCPDRSITHVPVMDHRHHDQWQELSPAAQAARHAKKPTSKDSDTGAETRTNPRRGGRSVSEQRDGQLQGDRSSC
jgi:hypothetical protein